MDQNKDYSPYMGMPQMNYDQMMAQYPQNMQYPKQTNQYSNQNFQNRVKNQKNYQEFYKTKMCPTFAIGNCYKGDKCSFAHSEAELRKKPDFYKTKLCDVFMKTGSCYTGEQCLFAHGFHELRSTPEFFKTALCYSWKNSGSCQAGDKCRYAHGIEEIVKSKQENNNYGQNSQNYYYNQKNDYAQMNDMDNYFPMSQPYNQNMMPVQNNETYSNFPAYIPPMPMSQMGYAPTPQQGGNSFSNQFPPQNYQNTSFNIYEQTPANMGMGNIRK